MAKEKTSSQWSSFQKEEMRYPEYEYPKVTVIIPTHNSDRNIAMTLDSVLSQRYPDLEPLVIDAGSTDRTLKILWESYGDRVRLCSVTSPMVYEMMNKAITLAEGEYLNFLYPGDYYIQKDAIRDIMTLALDHSKPELVYGGSLLRIRHEDLRSLFRPLDLKNLGYGLAPTALPACWFHRNLFSQLGTFNTSYEMRANLEYLCRVAKSPAVQVVATSRVYVDHEVRQITPHRVFVHFRETLRVVYEHFGVTTAIGWLFYQKDLLRLLRMAPPALKTALIGKTEESR